jgi:hypothetical protein
MIARSSLFFLTSSIGISTKLIVRPSALPSTRAAVGIVTASPAMSMARFFRRAGSVNASAPYLPMSSTAII